MEAGVSRDDVSYIHLDEDEKVTAETVLDEEDAVERVGAGAAGGAATGVVVGALAGLVVASGVLPGLGAIFVAGPLAAALGLTGAAATTISGAATGAVAGGLIGVLTGVGVAREDAETYDEHVRAGDILVVVKVSNEIEAESAKEIFKNHSAEEVRSYTP